MKEVEGQEGRENGIKWKRCEIKKKRKAQDEYRRKKGMRRGGNTWMRRGIKEKLLVGVWKKQEVKGGAHKKEELEIE